MNENRRSTNKIINFLNHLRNDDGFEQDNHRNIDGNNICLITGVELNDIIDKFNQERTTLGLNNTYCVVTRKNESVTALKSILINCNLNNNLWDELYSIDPKRYRFLKYIFTSLEIAREKRYDGAIKEALKLFKTNQEGYLTEPFKDSIIDEKIFKRSYSISLLEYLINDYDKHLDITLYEFYNVVLNRFFISCNFQLKKLSRGKFKEKAENVTVKELVSGINLKEVKTNEIRTIHKTKGAEFESVLIYFDDEKELNKIINPDINNEEDDYRLYYVALSRAEDFLCIATKSMEKEQIESCKELNIKML
jgi:DNA helicase-2/ATP-dependent DNA helicase PcrA